jgi:acyl-CoA synthetase (AMP-forming)/AMP-acid ligase II
MTEAAHYHHQIGPKELLGGILRSAPDLPWILKGLWNLARNKPDKIGSIGALFARRARRSPDRPAVTFEGRAWTYAQFNAWANRLGAAFKSAGVRPGDSVAVLMENRPEMLACVLGIVKIGAVATLLNHNQRGTVLAHSLRITHPKLVIVGAECAAGLDSLAADERALLCKHWWWQGETAAPAGMPSLEAMAAQQSEDNPPETDRIRLKDPCFYIFTSGTTGLPKASIMTHYRWHRVMAGLGQLGMRLRASDVLYCALPLYHNNALTVSWGAVLGAGATLALGRKFSASRFWDELRACKATAFCYIGELCRYLLAQPPRPDDHDHHVRVIIGNGLRPEIWVEFQQRFNIGRIAEFYAASEGNNAFINGFGLERTAGFCPLSFAIVEFDNDTERPVRGADGFMREVPKGGTGLLITEITDRAPMDGYTDKAATEAKIFRDVFTAGDAWFNTGDLVRDQGMRHIQFVDRVGDTFRWKGENVATTEVEAALNTIAHVHDAVVYGVEVPGHDGRAGMAAIKIDAERFDGERVAAHLLQTLPRYAVPLFIRLKEDHELTSTFKYRKVDLKREGFDPNALTDSLYVLQGERYTRLDPRLYEQLARDGFRFA